MHDPSHQEHRAYVPTSEEMEERYQSTERLWSGNPNESLVDYAAKLTPGTALDIGCGEGADALWLKNHGWDVLGIDFPPPDGRRPHSRPWRRRTGCYVQ